MITGQARWARFVVLAVLCVVAASRPASTQMAAAREYEVKAGFLFNFAKFVDWPEDAFSSPVEELRVDVVGHDPFDGALDRLVAGKTVRGHPLVIVYAKDLPVTLRPRIVFVSASERRRLGTLLAALRRDPALTVSDIEGFAEQGGVIGFTSAGDSLRFTVNRAGAARARLKVSSRLLALATVLEQDAVGAAPVAAK